MITKNKTQRVSTTLRQAVKDHVRNTQSTLYAVAKGSGLTYPAITRFVAGDRPLTQAESDRLCEYLGLVLVKEDGD